MALEAATLSELLTAVSACEGANFKVLAHMHYKSGAFFGLVAAVFYFAAVKMVQLLSPLSCCVNLLVRCLR